MAKLESQSAINGLLIGGMIGSVIGSRNIKEDGVDTYFTEGTILGAVIGGLIGGLMG